MRIIPPTEVNTQRSVEDLQARVSRVKEGLAEFPNEHKAVSILNKINKIEQKLKLNKKDADATKKLEEGVIAAEALLNRLKIPKLNLAGIKQYNNEKLDGKSDWTDRSDAFEP